YAAVIHERCVAAVNEYLASTQSEALAAMMVLPKPQHSSSFSSLGSGSTATIQPPSKAGYPLQHPLLAVAFPAANGLSVLRNKRKAQRDVEASPRVKRRKMTHDDVVDDTSIHPLQVGPDIHRRGMAAEVEAEEVEAEEVEAEEVEAEEVVAAAVVVAAVAAAEEVAEEEEVVEAVEEAAAAVEERTL
ncbi:hypothetical protein GGI14_005120, partial [Coemansia sp. S680]